ncbi:MAG: hypothetical protein R3F19_15620 [Verrucomicrobiales bacterium]
MPNFYFMQEFCIPTRFAQRSEEQLRAIRRHVNKVAIVFANGHVVVRERALDCPLPAFLSLPQGNEAT